MKKLLLLAASLLLLLNFSACARTQTTVQPAAVQSTEIAKSVIRQPTATAVTAVRDEPSQENKPLPTPTEIEPYAQTVGSFLAIHEVGLGPEGYISLTNFTSVPVTTKGLYLCQGADCFALPEAVIKPGSAGKVAVGTGEGMEGVIARGATIGALKQSDGEIALFASDKFDDPQAILVYLQWGSTPHALTELAVKAGLWIESGYAPTSKNAIRLYRLEESGWWLFKEANP